MAIKWERYGRTQDWRGYSPHFGYVRIQYSRKTKKWYLVDDGYTMTLGVFDSKKEAQKAAEPESNPSRRIGRQRRSARGRVPGVRKNPSGGAHYETTIGGLKVRYFQGYAEDIRYKRAADDKHYSHIVETDAAELYLCEHTIYGKCLLIVDPSGRTSLWE